MTESHLINVTKQFQHYKMLGDKTISVSDIQELKQEIVPNSNSVAIIVKHLCGNMLSCRIDLLMDDGEKSWRNRDEEFIAFAETKTTVLSQWNQGWDCLYTTLETFKLEDLERIIFIRNGGHTVTETLKNNWHTTLSTRTDCILNKLIKDDSWQSKSIPKGNSASYNHGKFSKEKERKHFTDGL